LSDYYGRSADVINRGFSGYNSRWLVDFMKLFVQHNSCHGNDFILATLFVGANDSVTSVSMQHVPLIEYKENILKIVHLLRVLNPNISIILITPPTVDHVLWPTRHNDSVYMYAQVILDVAIEQNIQVLNLWVGDVKIQFEDLCDGLHLGSGGNDKVFLGLREIIRKAFPTIVPEDIIDESKPNLSMHYPHWSEFNGLDSENSTHKINNWSWDS
jgi:lysophospholipase L1-like esterase